MLAFELTDLRIPWKRDLDAHLEAREKKPRRQRTRIRTLAPATRSDSRSDCRDANRRRWAIHVVRNGSRAPGRPDRYGAKRCRHPPGSHDSSWGGRTHRARRPRRIGASPEPPQVIRGGGFTLQLKPGRTIKGRVIDRDSGEPLAGMWVGPAEIIAPASLPSCIPGSPTRRAALRSRACLPNCLRRLSWLLPRRACRIRWQANGL